MVCSCVDPNKFVWEKIDEDSLSIFYVNPIYGVEWNLKSQKDVTIPREVQIKSESKDGYIRTIYNGNLDCDGGTFHYTKTITTYKNEDAEINIVENSFVDNPKALRLTLRGDDALHYAVCGL